MWDGQLGDFLRSRREALPPGAVGLKAGPRRRAPGLRRSEVAVRAGISVEYLTRLEQGHDTNPSVAVLAALADALLLDAVDRWHLHGLASIARGVELLAADDLGERSVRDSVVRVVTRLEPVPACVVDHMGDLRTWNRSFRSFALPLGLLAGSPPNLIRWVFESDQATQVLDEWDAVADDAAAWLYTLGNGDPSVERLARELTDTAGPAFSARWRSHPVGSPGAAPRMWRHPDAGALTLHFEAFAISRVDRLHLVVLEPADDPTEHALARQAAAPC